LVARGEFSIVIAGLGISAELEPQLGALSAAYVLLMAVMGPILAHAIEPIMMRFVRQ
jgi:CPA2 family monovalent cation:H+ antiporter-2